ncbi:G-protein coupled receptor GRL101-like isoform X2 [Argopecten irradians]|uniref:G-protein coupled receptor GRL101-like isoform X2 n=1 Tax=Argopecten irradians TaxID=31199 RepID=UPI0037147A96
MSSVGERYQGRDVTMRCVCVILLILSFTSLSVMNHSTTVITQSTTTSLTAVTTTQPPTTSSTLTLPYVSTSPSETTSLTETTRPSKTTSPTETTSLTETTSTTETTSPSKTTSLTVTTSPSETTSSTETTSPTETTHPFETTSPTTSSTTSAVASTSAVPTTTKGLNLTGPIEVNFQETLVLTCTTADSSLIPLRWFRNINSIKEIRPGTDRWRYRTTIKTTTSPDNVTASVLQIQYSSIGDAGLYMCFGNQTIQYRFVKIKYDRCTAGNDSIFVPGKGCLFAGYTRFCNDGVAISEWKDQLVASDLILMNTEKLRFMHWLSGDVNLKLTNDDRNFLWKSFKRDKSKRLSFTAWYNYTLGNDYQTCISISTLARDIFRNWKYSKCNDMFYICLNSTGVEQPILQQPTYIPDTPGLDLVPQHVLDRLFRCRQTGEYILHYFVCDNRPDCTDHSDEDACARSNQGPSAVTFLCNNGKYISLNLACDFYADCHDNSDETNCYIHPCLSGQWTCNSGQCIADYQVCDTEEECADGSDEWSSTCTGYAKKIDSVWQCSSSRHVPIHRTCDHIPDCLDGSDETFCNLGNPTFSCTTYCPDKLCPDSAVRVHIGTNGYETVGCSFPSKNVTQMSWPFSTFISTPPDDTNCYFRKGHNGYITIKLVDDQPVPIRYRNEHMLDVLRYRSRQCYQRVQMCFNDFNGAVPQIFVSSELDSLQMRNITLCGFCLKSVGCVYLTSLSGVSHLDCDEWTTVVTGEDVPIRWVAKRNYDHAVVMHIGPPSCIEDEDFVDPKYLEPQLLCENGMSYYPHQICLMEFDTAGEPTACRDLTHLQNCETFSCPEHFMKCPNSYCVPARFLCDDVSHCPNSEDEQQCDNFTCPGYFRCRTTKACVPLDQVCDGVAHCPQADDERNCDVTCPDSCSCRGLIFHCVQDNVKNTKLFSELPRTTKRLSVQANLSDWTGHLPLAFPAMFVLSMQHCRIRSLFDGNTSVLSDLKFLRTLDLSYNDIATIQTDSFSMLLVLQYLFVNNNPIVTIEDNAFAGLRLLKEFSLTGSRLHTLSSNVFVECDGLIYLNLSSNQIQTLQQDTFTNLADVTTLDLRNNQINQVYEHMFRGLSSLTFLYVDSFTLCCAKPVSVTDTNCFAPRDNISSCTDLIRESLLRIILWIIGIIALLGNIFVLVYRFKYDRSNLTKSYSIFVINLSFSDTLMGMYMMSIGVADEVYRGRYVWEENSWRHSLLCTVSGVFSTISSEASTFLILLITLDRTLAIVFPFSVRRFSKNSAVITSAIVWVISILLAILPVLTFKDYFKGTFYSTSGVCLALPLSATATPGSEYSRAVFVCLNLTIFLVIAICQVVIYKKSKIHSSLRNTTTKQARDIAVARTLTAVVATDFFCWFPIGVLGVWTWFGGTLSGEVYAWIMVLVLPINSALNPLLYTFANIRKQRKNRHRLPASDRRTKSDTETSNMVMAVLRKFRFKKGNTILKDYLNSPGTELMTSDAFLITLHLSRSLAFLHKQGLVHGSISADAIEIYVENNRVKAAVFLMDHHVHPESDQLKDMYDLGKVVKELLRKVKLP